MKAKAKSTDIQLKLFAANRDILLLVFFFFF